MEKFKLHTPDRISENVAKLAELFPSCVTEARDDKGKTLLTSEDWPVFSRPHWPVLTVPRG